ncbi:META domain-containing protein [Pseudonocardia ammonioxydans]|uniref:META domain-containing protein n=1 Tax=Pseudonocardia ammonioxydans TaxID=260086 RepID=A0A1I4VXE7_PSUAM|nr:META domain-containing protein [Pseudonocardia ammonioxydans]SFN05830.1 META domain-containing protein [Pseudonocardia ammonioxydans]
MNRMMLVPAVLAVLVLLGCADASASPGAGAASGERPATAQDLLGRWFPADGVAQGRAFADFTADGGWTGSDGCNGQRGTWELGPDGAFTGTAGPSTLMACENVPVARWVSDAGRAGIRGDDLVLYDAGGAERAHLVRELP